MKDEYLSFLGGFISKIKKERVIFELRSEKKRTTAFSKLTNFSEYFDKKNIMIDLTHLEDEEAVKKLAETMGQADCFDLVYEEICPLEKAYRRAVASGMFDALIVDKYTIVYVGECEFGASEKYILRK